MCESSPPSSPPKIPDNSTENSTNSTENSTNSTENSNNHLGTTQLGSYIMDKFLHRNQNTPPDVVPPFHRMSHQVLPHPGDYVTVKEKNETSVLSLPSHIAHSGRTIATMLNTCQEPDFFLSLGALGPAPATTALTTRA